MIGYERTYATGRLISSILELFGWVLVVFGVLAALIGFATGGLIGALQMGFSGREPELIVSLLAMIPGLLLVWSGLLSIMFSQMGKASLDGAEMQREMLQLAKTSREPNQTVENGSSAGRKNYSVSESKIWPASVKNDAKKQPEALIESPTESVLLLDVDFDQLIGTIEVKSTGSGFIDVYKFPGSIAKTKSLGDIVYVVRTKDGYNVFRSISTAQNFARNL